MTAFHRASTALAFAAATLLVAPGATGQPAADRAGAAARLAQRVPIAVSSAEHGRVILDMHALLKSVSDIQGAAAKHDWAAVERVAAGFAPDAIQGAVDPELKSFQTRLPEGWRQHGGPMHTSYARIVDEAQRGKRVEVVMQLLSQTTRHCVDCHETYQLRAQP